MESSQTQDSSDLALTTLYISKTEISVLNVVVLQPSDFLLLAQHSRMILSTVPQLPTPLESCSRFNMNSSKNC